MWLCIDFSVLQSDERWRHHTWAVRPEFPAFKLLPAIPPVVCVAESMLKVCVAKDVPLSPHTLFLVTKLCSLSTAAATALTTCRNFQRNFCSWISDTYLIFRNSVVRSLAITGVGLISNYGLHHFRKYRSCLLSRGIWYRCGALRILGLRKRVVDKLYSAEFSAVLLWWSVISQYCN